MRGWMVEYLFSNKLLDPFQMPKVVNDLSRAVDLKCGSVLTLLYFSKAFDSINDEFEAFELL
jgi:hypothetical protein